MKVVFSGSRNWSDTQLVHLLTQRIRVLPSDTVILHGGYRGVDTHVGKIAKRLGYAVNVYPAQWSLYGPSAGPIRNLKMLAESPNVVVAFHDNLGVSKGTKYLILHANKKHIPVELWTPTGRYYPFYLHMRGTESNPFI